MNSHGEATRNEGVQHVGGHDGDVIRRGFLYKAVTVAFGAVAGLFPALAGLAAFLDPVRRRRASGEAAANFVTVTTIQSIPSDGVPRQYPVVADQIDAWTLFPSQRIGSVFLRRTAADQPVQCFTSICPHAGCSVSYSSETDTYKCPCHNSQFSLNGEPIAPTPSPRGMDPLDVEVTENGEVQVNYVSYLTGRHERKAK